MVAIRKFLFDTDFAPKHPAPPANQAGEPAVKAEADPVEEEAPPPVFSEEDMAMARHEGFAAGKQDGIREAADSMERQVAETLGEISGRLPDLFAAQRTAAEALQHDGMAVIRALARKALPRLAESNGLGEIEHLAALVLDRLRTEPRVVFTVNNCLADPVREKLAATARTKGYAGSIDVIGDAGITPGDCRIEWSQGGAERQAAAILDQMDTIIARNTGGCLGGPAADAASPAAADGDAVPADEGLDGN
jgi:flagellar assembly protein FliH